MFYFIFVEVSEFADDNASTTETDDNKISEEIEETEDEEGIDGVSSEGEKTLGGNETVEVRLNLNNCDYTSQTHTMIY